MLVLVPTKQTLVSKKEFLRALAKTWYANYNALPTQRQLGVVFAHWMLETAGSVYCWNYNICNIKAIDISGQTVKYCMLRNTWEIISGKKYVYQPPHPATWFRAFDSIDEGMGFYIGFLRNKRYKAAWAAVEKGDPKLFTHLLKVAGYYTAPEGDYLRAMEYHFSKFLKDPIFEEITQQLVEELAEIEFPPHYQPVDELTFKVIEDTVERKNVVGSNFSFKDSLTAKFKKVFNF